MRLFVIVFIILSFSAAGQKSGPFNFEDDKIDTLKTGIDSVLILGMGPVTSAIFLDNVSEKIIKSLESGKLTAEYRYLGKTPKEVKEEFNKIKLENYKTVLLFHPRDSVFFETKITKTSGSIPVKGGRLGWYFISHRFNYEGAFDLTLYSNEDKMRIV